MLGKWSEPNDNSKSSNCALMWFGTWSGANVDGTWADDGCNKKTLQGRKFIPLCEKDEGRLHR